METANVGYYEFLRNNEEMQYVLNMMNQNKLNHYLKKIRKEHFIESLLEGRIRIDQFIDSKYYYLVEQEKGEISKEAKFHIIKSFKIFIEKIYNMVENLLKNKKMDEGILSNFFRKLTLTDKEFIEKINSLNMKDKKSIMAEIGKIRYILLKFWDWLTKLLAKAAERSKKNKELYTSLLEKIKPDQFKGRLEILGIGTLLGSFFLVVLSLASKIPGIGKLFKWIKTIITWPFVTFGKAVLFIVKYLIKSSSVILSVLSVGALFPFFYKIIYFIFGQRENKEITTDEFTKGVF